MKFCPKCGASLADGVKFCMECGEKIQVRPPEPEPVYAPPEQPPEPEPVYAPPVQPPVQEQVYAQPMQPPVQEQVYAPPKMQAPPKPKKKHKWLFFAIPGAVLVLALTVVAVLLLLRGGGKQEIYYAVSSDDWIALQENGKATICIQDTEFKARWKQKGDNLTMEQDGDTYKGTLEDGVLTIELAGTDYVFVKELTGAVTYKAVSCISGGQILDEELMDSIGGVYVRFLEDGTGTFYCFGEKVAFTYDKKAMEMGGETVPYTIEGDTMEFTYVDGSGFTLEETDKDPEAAGKVENGWEEPEVSEDFMRYLDWPGQNLSDLDLSGVWLEVRGEDYSGSIYLNGMEVEGLHLFLYDRTYEEVYGKLTELCGEAVDEGEEPYVEANGGAVSYSWFNYKTGTIKVSSASERDYLEIEMAPG